MSHIVLFFDSLSTKLRLVMKTASHSSILLRIQLWHVHSPQGSWGHFMGVPQIWGVLRSILRSIQAKLSIKRKRINSVFADKRAEFGWLWELIRVNVQPVSSVWYLCYIRYLQCSWALHRCQHDLRDGYLQCIYGYMIFAHYNSLYIYRCMYVCMCIYICIYIYYSIYTQYFTICFCMCIYVYIVT